MNQKRCHFWAMKTLLSFLFFHSQPSQSGMPSSRHDTRRRLMAVVIPAKTKLQRLLYTENTGFTEDQHKCTTASCFNQARALMHGRQLQELFWGSVSFSCTLVCKGLGHNYWKLHTGFLINLFYNSLLNIFCWNCYTQPCTTSTVAKTIWCHNKKTTSYQQYGCLVVFEVTYKANLSKRSSLCLSSPENRNKSSFVSVCGRSIVSWG